MKIITYRKVGGPVRTGVVVDQRVLDISQWIGTQPQSEDARKRNEAAGVTGTADGVMRLLQAGSGAISALASHVRLAVAKPGTQLDLLTDVQLYAPVPRPGKIIGVGRNYADHAKETGVSPFEKPRIIFKMPSSVSAPGAPVSRPTAVAKMDFEAELAVVIGGYGKNVAESDALSLVAGFTILNDLSAREFQFDISPAQTTFAKSMDGFAPMGPWLVTKDEIPDPQTLDVSCWLNGKQMQHANTRDMLFPVATLIAYLSQYMTLEPGDIITTGTPAGIGAFRQPPVFLQPGDTLRFEVTGIGVMEHRIA
jgi:2-keto-4-pentenoate hydratase/2-oxohepta-3-ene-1,7-dioic acid hydratase in catechol pathway